jgi:hypothetical protein
MEIDSYRIYARKVLRKAAFFVEPKMNVEKLKDL